MKIGNFGKPARTRIILGFMAFALAGLETIKTNSTNSGKLAWLRALVSEQFGENGLTYILVLIGCMLILWAILELFFEPRSNK